MTAQEGHQAAAEAGATCQMHSVDLVRNRTCEQYQNSVDHCEHWPMQHSERLRVNSVHCRPNVVIRILLLAQIQTNEQHSRPLEGNLDKQKYDQAQVALDFQEQIVQKVFSVDHRFDRVMPLQSSYLLPRPADEV